MARVRARDAAAFEALYDAHHRLVYGIAIRILGDTGAAEDVAQAVFLKIWPSAAAQLSRGSRDGMNAHDTMLDDVAVYALGALPPKEAAAVRGHIATCAECAAEYRRLKPAVDAVAYSAEACADSASGGVVAS